MWGKKLYVARVYCSFLPRDRVKSVWLPEGFEGFLDGRCLEGCRGVQKIAENGRCPASRIREPVRYKHAKLSPPSTLWKVEFFRGRPRGGDNFTSLFQVLQTLYSKRQKHPFSP